MWTACHKVVEHGFEAREGRNVVVLDFVPVGFRSCCLQVNEEKLILLDCKILLLDLNVSYEFALHAKVEKSIVEGKGKLSVIRSIRRKIADSVEGLSDDDQIEFVDGLIAHLGQPPLKGMEDQCGQEELESKDDLKKLKKELGELESKQQLVEEQLAKM